MTMFRSMKELQDTLPTIFAAPKNTGRVDMLCVRPAVDERKVLETSEFSPENGAHGDRWQYSKRKYGLDDQIAIMPSRVIDSICDGDRNRWALAGDLMFVDLDLSSKNLKAGDHLKIGEALFEVTPKEHNGCRKFSQRFGRDALAFVNQRHDPRSNLRGIYLKNLVGGTVQQGDKIVVVRNTAD